MASQKKYTSSAELQNYFIENIAPNYFDFENTNNYRIGLFGYINELISTITMDTHHTINIARREFYPVTAQNPSSFYKMAALQQIGLPLVTPGQCKAVLILDRDEVISNSSYKNGVYTCVIDKSVSILADNIPFSLLYPIIIVSNQAGGGKWNHTIHYDKSNTNDLDKQKTSYYLAHRTIKQDGKNYLLLSVMLYQCKREPIISLCSSDSRIETGVMLINFDGNLANFEVFYKDEPDDSKKPIQLKKLLQGQSMVEAPFCYYRLLNSNQIELSFPKNIYFTPELNSEIQVDVYTSLGKDGEFPKFVGDLTCTMNSEDYPYNNNMTMLGQTDGRCKLAINAPTIDMYKETIKAAYATNSTITTSNDLQILFDQNSMNYNRIYFRKKRHDAFDRLYGAYVLLKDESNNVLPTNTLTLKLSLKDFDSYNDATTRAIIRPGRLIEYDPTSFTSEIYTGIISEDLKLTDDLSVFDMSSERFIYANPFLIMCTMDPCLIGYYVNSINETRSIEYTYMNDESIMQFIGNNFSIERNSIIGEDYYKFSIKISPTSDLDTKDVLIVPDVNDADYLIRASEPGIISNIHFDTDLGTPVAEILYDSGSRDIIQLGSYIDQIPEENEEPSDEEETYEEEDQTEEEPTDDYHCHSGYSLNINVYDHFIEGDILAYKKVTDKGKIRAALDISGVLFDNGLYIPMTIEEYDTESNIYTLVGYISTDDIIDTDNTLLISEGIYGLSGVQDDDVVIPFRDLKFCISVFYRNGINTNAHKYDEFDYFRMHTLTNTYMEDSENGISLIQPIDYIRSTLLFEEYDTTPDVNIGEDEYESLPDAEDEDDLPLDESEDEEVIDEEETEFEEYASDELDEDMIVTLKEVPLVKADWIKNDDNFTYMMQSLLENYDSLQTIYYDLENNFNFDLKFYNTYGKSKFFKAGISNKYKPLSQVNLSFRFGIHLPGFTSESTFLEKFRPFVKEYIESTNSMTQQNQSIFILNLTKAIYDNFKEVGHCEYFGFNDFGEDTQKIVPVPTTEMSKELLANYIPEFINIASHMENGVNVLNVDVEFLSLDVDA